MIRERTGKRRYSRASMGISMAFAVVACSLSISSAKAAVFEINVTLDPGVKFALGDWVAQQSLDVTGATRLLGEGATPSPASVRVDEHDENGQIIASLPSQFDVESKDPFTGTLSCRSVDVGRTTETFSNHLGRRSAGGTGGDV